ncbi:MAG: GNAT family N-acetyltransferase [Thermomicrobiales bacterium]
MQDAMKLTVPGDFVREPIPDQPGASVLSLVVDGEQVSRTGIVPYTLRIGSATVRMDGIGGVATPEAHRNKGYSRRALAEAVEQMTAGDAVLTSLYGIPDYYPRWGYATAAHEGIIRLDRLDRDAVIPEGLAVRAATREDLLRIRTIYADATRTLVGPAVRADDGLVWSELAKAIAEWRDECRVIVDETDEVLAYAWMASFIWWMKKVVRNDPEALHIGEAFAETPRAADALLAAIRQWTSELGKPHAEIHQPPVGAFGMAARLQDTAIVTITFRDMQFMARSTGTAALLAAVAGELRARWLDARLGWSGTLRIVADGEAVEIVLSPDGLDVVSGTALPAESDAIAVEVTPGDLARLVLGTFPPRDLLDRIGVSGDAAAVLAVVFPERQPYLWPADRF